MSKRKRGRAVEAAEEEEEEEEESKEGEGKWKQQQRGERMGGSSKKSGSSRSRSRRVQVIVAGKGGSCSDAEEEGSELESEDEVPVEGQEEDAILVGAESLTLEEVMRRRSRRTNQLIRLYKQQYWSLMEELRAKYRRFYLRHGKSGWREEGEGVVGGEGGMKVAHAPDRPAPESLKCGAQGCSSKPLPLSVFCFAHILMEPRQKLYQPCTFIIRSGQSGSITCGRPTLRAMVPLLCTTHFQQAQQQAARTLKKANLGTSTSKAASKLHLMVAEYIRAIQAKRRALRLASSPADKKDGKLAAASVKKAGAHLSACHAQVEAVGS